MPNLKIKRNKNIEFDLYSLREAVFYLFKDTAINNKYTVSPLQYILQV